MANEEHVQMLKQGVASWSLWRDDWPDIQPDLSGLDLTGANLIGANLMKADLSDSVLDNAMLQGANLAEADLRRVKMRATGLAWAHLLWTDLASADLGKSSLIGANLLGAKLPGAILRLADLTEANCAGTDLTRADLTLTNLIGANFSRAMLNQAVFDRAKMGFTSFGGVDLSATIGLDTTMHVAPSHVDVLTLYRSGGRISRSFLQGVGIPGEFVTSCQSLFTKEYRSCAISHSSQDSAFSERLQLDLKQVGVLCWFGPEDIRIGDRIRQAIDESIQLYDKVLVVLSKDSVVDDRVEQAVETALERERKHDKTVLFPIRVDGEVLQIESGWPALIRNSRRIGDFTQWKDRNAYQSAFQRLLRDLKVEESDGK